MSKCIYKVEKCITLTILVFLFLIKFNIVVIAESELYWPTDTKYKITTGYYYSNNQCQYGVDIGAPSGTPLYALVDGIAEFYQCYTTINNTRYLTSYGNCVYLTSTSGKYFMIYGHMNSFTGCNLQIPSSVTKAQSGADGKILLDKREVKAGELLGYIGNTGYSFGNHLHFGLKINGSFVDPTNYLNPSQCIVDVQQTDNYVNLGDEFYALILQRQTWIPITNDDDEVARLHTETGDSNQLWQFIRQDDGSYVILSAADGEALELYNGITDDGNPVKVHNDYWGGNYQRWYIYRQDNGYVIMSAHYKDYELVLDLRYDNKSDGAEVITYRRNNADVQIWGIYKVDDEDLRPKNVRINVGNSASKTTFYWDDAYGESCYAVKIHKISQDTNELYHVEWGATSGYGIQLPPGDYYAYVASVTQLYNKGSENIYFTVEESDHVDLGTNFYAYIINTARWKHLTKDSDCNVTMRTETGKSNQIWFFERQSDGSYTIRCVEDGRYLDVHNLGTTSGTNVKVYDYNGSDAQFWYIYGNSGEYRLKAKCTECVLDVSTGSYADGTNIQMWESDDTDAQLFQIWELELPVIPKPSIGVKIDEQTQNVTFQWDKVSNAHSYDLRIKSNGETINTIMSQTGTSYSIKLEAGTYTANIAAVNENFLNYTFSDDINFTVLNTYTLNFDSNGGNNAPSSQIKIQGKTLTLSSVKPSRTGYIFKNWNSKADGSGTSYAPGDLYTVDSDQTLYAQWEKVIPYTETQVIKSGTKLIVDTKLYDFIAPYDILIGGYNGDKIVAVKIISSNEQNFPYTLEGNIDKVKVMVWSDLSTLKPLCEAEEITSDKFIIE